MSATVRFFVDERLSGILNYKYEAGVFLNTFYVNLNLQITLCRTYVGRDKPARFCCHLENSFIRKSKTVYKLKSMVKSCSL